MPNYTQRAVNNFIKGLITEAGELTFPENASVDELNCTLQRDGSRRRRKAIRFESNNVLSDFNVTADTILNFGEWENVGNDSNKIYLIVQVGDRLYFYDKNIFPFSSGKKANFVNLAPYAVGATGGASTTRCDFTTILGNLIVVSANTDPVYVTENSDGTFSVTEISCRERDFKWLGDKSEYDREVAVSLVSAERIYDTYNAGWEDRVGDRSVLSGYLSSRGAYPPLTVPWYAGKDSGGAFEVTSFTRIGNGNTLIGNGHFILVVFNKNRSLVSESEALLPEIERTRFKTTVSFASRVFFSGLGSSANSGKIYFSRILEDIREVGEFYQSNDPTAETISDLLDTDGGVIVIPDANNIKKLYAFRSSIFAFADNGIWQIKGVDDVFKPTSYSISRISEVGIVSESSFLAAEGVPFWWSRFGIHTLSFDEFGNAREENLSIGTIQTFWDEISSSAKLSVQATYDKVNKRAYWLYKNNNETIANKYNRVLVLDVQLQAFYPWAFSDQSSDTDYALGLQFYRGFSSAAQTFNVVVGADNTVVGSDNVVDTSFEEREDNDVSVIFFVRDTSSNKMTMASLSGFEYLDWGTVNYVSYAETGYDFVGDAVLRKTAPYLVVYMRESETGWTGNDTDGYVPINDSSLLVSAYWDFNKTASSSPQQAYRRKRPVFVTSDQTTFSSEESVVITRLKLRGRGRSLRIRMESEQGKDFIYLGHGMIADVASRF